MTHERYMITAVPLRGGERVDGYYFALGVMSSHRSHHVLSTRLDLQQQAIKFDLTEIDPATIEPVRQKIVVRGWDVFCPACDRDIFAVAALSHAKASALKYCLYCGQALDLDEVLGGAADG